MLLSVVYPMGTSVCWSIIVRVGNTVVDRLSIKFYDKLNYVIELLSYLNKQ